MKTVAHLSDLHFGTELPNVAAALAVDLAQLRPDLVIVSGDLTQRARRAQFAAARDYLARLPHPQLVVPGNHDVPLYDVLRRFLAPLTRYRHFISTDLNPVWQDETCCVIGLNTARSFTWKNGRISAAQIDFLRDRLRAAGSRLKIVVTHHPFIPPPNDAGIALVGRAARAVTVLDGGEVDVVVAGHLHQGYAGDIRTHYPASRRSIIAAQAGTAISHRTRHPEANAYNVLRLTPREILIENRAWNGGAFGRVRELRFQKHPTGWLPAAAP